MGLYSVPNRSLQLADRFEVLGLKSRTHVDEKFFVTAQDDEIKDADIRRDRRGRASDILNCNEGQARLRSAMLRTA